MISAAPLLPAPLQLFFFVAFDAAPEAGGEGRVGVYVAVGVNGLGIYIGKGEDGVDVGQDALEQLVVFEDLAAGGADAAFDLVGAFGNGGKGGGDGEFGFVEVGDVVDEGELFAGVDEAEAGAVAAGDDGGVAEAVEEGVGGGEGAVDGVGVAPTVAVVVTAVPGYAIFFAGLGVGLANANAFETPDLRQGEVWGEGGGEAVAVHVDDDLLPFGGAADEFGLVEQALGFAGFAETLGIEASGILACPENGAAVVGEGFDGGVGDGGAGAEHEEGEVGDGDVGAAVFLDEFDGLLAFVEDGVFDVEVAEGVA